MNIPTMSHYLSICAPSWNNLDLLKKFIPNLKKTCDVDYKIFVALNESKDESPEFLRSEGVEFCTLKENFGTLSIDLMSEYFKSEYIVNVNDDSLFAPNWGSDLINLIEEHYPAASQVRGVEKRHETCNVVVGDPSLPNWFDNNAEEVFWNNCNNGKYKRPLQHALWHPICCKTKDYIKVGKYSDNWDENWLWGHSLDTNFAIRLWQLDNNYKFLLSGNSWYYHLGSFTNNKVKETAPEKNNKHNMDYLYRKTKLTHKEFHRIIKYGEIFII